MSKTDGIVSECSFLTIFKMWLLCKLIISSNVFSGYLAKARSARKIYRHITNLR